MIVFIKPGPNGPYVLDMVITDGGKVFHGANLFGGPLLWKAAVRARRAHPVSVSKKLLGMPPPGDGEDRVRVRQRALHLRGQVVLYER